MLPRSCYKLRIHEGHVNGPADSDIQLASRKCTMPHVPQVPSLLQTDYRRACRCDQMNISHHHTCWTSAPVASHSAEMELMEEILCARKALAVSLDSSADHRLAHRMRSSGIQCSYTLFRTFTALLPLSVSFPPIRTCSQQMRCEVSKATVCG